MANIKPLVDKIIRLEGGWSNDPDDNGGQTNMGVTLKTWQSVGYDKNKDGSIDSKDLKIINKEDVELVIRKIAWDKWKADEIKNQSIAEFLVDWVYNSGNWGIKIPQRKLKLNEDGIVGKNTLNSINTYPYQRDLFQLLKESRIEFVNNIVKNNPSQQKFLKGWLNRINEYEYK